ncbi:MAG: hypothetical protein OJF55_001731 [Rhodanobacteraceae bacterium]|nr:MAG: hypothetical protein OJF55_001731 [Rhodanobacteraceae bacterium]
MSAWLVHIAKGKQPSMVLGACRAIRGRAPRRTRDATGIA